MRKWFLAALGIFSAIGIGVVCLGPLAHGSAPAAAANNPIFSAPDGWERSEVGPGMLVYEGKTDRHEWVSILEDPSIKGQLPQSDDARLIQTMKEGSEFPRFLAGITDWKVDRVERSLLSTGGRRITVTGSYLNIEKERVYFQEWKYFLQAGYGQIDYTELARGALPGPGDQPRIDEVMKRYHPFGS